jgi:hypothetical protein
MSPRILFEVTADRCRTLLSTHYDRAWSNLDRHGVHFPTAYVAGV